jgi:glycosyltransferase involved in cell wall biosynthesis
MKKQYNDISMSISAIIPFYNPPIKLFDKCLHALKRLNLHEVILVDDCSTDVDIIKIAKQSGFIYMQTPYQSGHDGLPFNLGVNRATGKYICRIDADDVLLELPTTIKTDVYFGRIDRVKPLVNITVEELILAPRSCTGIIAKKELFNKYPYPEDPNVFGDVLFALRILHNNHSYAVHPKINYIYHKVPSSIQNSKPKFYHRLRNIQTVARFCQLEYIEPTIASYYLKLAMLNIYHGSNALKIFHQKTN